MPCTFGGLFRPTDVNKDKAGALSLVYNIDISLVGQPIYDSGAAESSILVFSNCSVTSFASPFACSAPADAWPFTFSEAGLPDFSASASASRRSISF